MCPVFGQDTITFDFQTEDVPVLEADTLEAAEVSEPDSIHVSDFTPTLFRSWRHAHPFRHLPDSAYDAARADTLLNKDVHPFRYSPSKLVKDSLKAVARYRARYIDPKEAFLQRDLRLPLFVTSDIPADSQPSIVGMANDFSEERWNYVIPADSRFKRLIETANLRSLAVYNYVKGNPARYSYSSGSIELPPSLDSEEVSAAAAKSLESKSLELGSGAKAFTQIGGIQSQVKTDIWHHAGSSVVQMSQTALSDNWYKGGDNNMTVSTVQMLALTTYDENKKTSFDILLELRLSALYSKADTVNPLRVNDNLMSANIKYGYQAWKRWFYSTSLYAKTPVFDYHNTNSRVTKSSFLAPLEANLSVGMEYKYISKDKRINYTLLLAPLAYDMKYVSTSRVNAKSYGIEDGKHSLHKFGATVSSTLSWRISNDVSWASRLYYFTSYDNIRAEFENTLNVSVGRRFTCQIYVYPRFDDKVDDKIQIKEMLTFGINYVW